MWNSAAGLEAILRKCSECGAETIKRREIDLLPRRCGKEITTTRHVCCCCCCCCCCNLRLAAGFGCDARRITTVQETNNFCYCFERRDRVDGRKDERTDDREDNIKRGESGDRNKRKEFHDGFYRAWVSTEYLISWRTRAAWLNDTRQKWWIRETIHTSEMED